MRIQILDDEGEVVNTILADEDFCEKYYPGRWRVEPEPEIVEPEIVEPEIVEPEIVEPEIVEPEIVEPEEEPEND